MPKTIIRNVPLNRVEGDLEIKVEIADGAVVDAWSSGTMFRGFERILVGRGAMDGLVITPRICGLCNICHLTAASQALDRLAGVEVPSKGVKVRNVVMMSEHIQSDVRQSFLMFTADFTNPAYKNHSLFEEARKRYEPFKGETVVSTLRESKKIPEIIAILGGQWPHTSFMVPGGIVSLPSRDDILESRHLLAGFRKWYETKVLGCSIDRWSEVRSLSGLDAWIEESASHRDSDVGFVIRFGREAGLNRTGRGVGRFLSFGALDLPRGTSVAGAGSGTKLVPAGIATGAQTTLFEEDKITEDVAHSWFEDSSGPLHPYNGETKPYATGGEGGKYSWCKAPRYEGQPAETGPLAEAMVARNPLFTDMIRKEGPSSLARQLARLVRPAELIPAMDAWLTEIMGEDGEFYSAPAGIPDGQAMGLTQAARGALGHWIKIRGGKIAHYQIITPTAWNGSPRDSGGKRGPWEEALVGTPVRDADNPVEIGHVVRSFDPCLVCTVHSLRKGATIGRIRL